MMKLALIALVLLVGVACELGAARSHSNSLAWRHFKKQHGKVYATQEEDARRFAIFMANKQLVDSHNANASRSFDMGLNHLSDWTAEEKARLRGLRVPEGPREIISGEELAKIIGGDTPVPDEVDWRKMKGRVSGVKDQGSCGSCWAFSTTGLLEGQELPQNMSSLVALSEQLLVDCSYKNEGCMGGWMGNALDDIADSIGGVESEADYPYTGKNELKCNDDDTKFLPLNLTGHKLLPKADADTLKKTVANYGPVSVGFDATDDFVAYQSGIYKDHRCKLRSPNHGVLVVGYGKDSKEGDYWIIKNSWSTKWGEEGYFRMKAGMNLCGIESFGTIATFA